MLHRRYIWVEVTDPSGTVDKRGRLGGSCGPAETEDTAEPRPAPPPPPAPPPRPPPSPPPRPPRSSPRPPRSSTLFSRSTLCKTRVSRATCTYLKIQLQISRSELHAPEPSPSYIRSRRRMRCTGAAGGGGDGVVGLTEITPALARRYRHRYHTLFAKHHLHGDPNNYSSLGTPI